MEHEFHCVKPAGGNGHQIPESCCPKCKLLHRQYCFWFCLMLALFAIINMVTMIYLIGRMDTNSNSDIMNQLHVLQARIETLESTNSRVWTGATGTQNEFVEPSSAEGRVESPLKGLWRQNRVKREENQKNGNRNRRKSCNKPKIDAVHNQGTGGESYPEYPRDNLSGTFHKWKYAEWYFKNKARRRQFHLDFDNGNLTVKQPGLYLVYSQITLKGNGTQGYHVIRNNQDPILACYSNNMMLHDEDKTSCFTMGIFKLEKNDKICIKHVSTSGIRAVFTSNASFFGLVKLGKFNKRGVVTAV